MSKILTTADVVARFKLVHGDRYDYSQVVYVNAKTKVKIGCKKHGFYEQTPNGHHNQKYGCWQCAVEERASQLMISEKEFLERAKSIHKNAYDYSKAKYNGRLKSVIVTCKIHGDFKVKAGKHIDGAGCQACSLKSRVKKRTLSNEEFIKKAKAIHGNLYLYDKVKYISSRDSVLIGCKKHGYFEIKPNGHLSKKAGCNACAIERSRTNLMMTKREFVKKANSVHKSKYDYSDSIYNGYDRVLKIRCAKHGIFRLSPCHHIGNKKGCAKCAKEIRMKKKGLVFINNAKKIHSGKYDYSQVFYNGARRKVDIICPIHGLYRQTPTGHLRCGCNLCGFESAAKKMFKGSLSKIDQARKVHNNKYDYSLVEERMINEKVKIICPDHGVYLQSMDSHCQGVGCFRCKTSKGENKIRDFLNSQNIAFIDQRPVKGMHRKYLIDFYLPDYNLFIEYHGKQHYERNPHFHRKKSDFQRQLTRDQKLRDLCQQRGIDLLEIGYFDFDRIEEILSEKLLGVEVKRSKQLKLQL